MAQIKDEKLDTSINNGPNTHHGPNINQKPKEEFHGGRGGRGNRFQPYGGPNRDRKGGPRDNNMPRGDFRNDSNQGDHQGDSEIMNRGGRNHNDSGRGGRRGGGVGGGGFRGGPPNRVDDRITRADAVWNERLMQIMGPTHELPQTDNTERKFLSQCRLYIGNLVDCTEEELIEMFKPYGEVSENFLNKEKMFAFIRLDYRTNAEKAKRELDGQMRKGRMLKIRFAPIAAAIKVKNLTPFVSNELLEYAFSIFGDIERCQVMVDERGNSTGEGIIEFSRKNAASNALKRCSEGCFFLTSSLRPCVVETYEFVDSSDGLPDKLLPKKTMDFQKQREVGPRFANPNSFEHEFGTRWKQLAELYKQKEEALKREMKLEEEKLEAQMEYARYEHETEMLREQLRQREMDRERQKMEWEMKERQAEEQRLREEDIFRRQSEDLSMRMHHQDEEMRRRQQDNSSFMQDHRGGPPGKPQFDGPPMPVEGMTVRELEAITAQGGMESTPFVETFVRDNQGVLPPPGLFDAGPRGDRGGRWGQDRRNGQDRRRF
ncbi:hrp65 protein-like isoform X2 [Sipha flava]|uniref:Hrp65 protein n=1 Tax=Sipha flava TaxID=143950 RepID=A0A2S2Q0M1_9HEMI|nr:hrp65 protein-like isoform X2 [Sipha flava]